MAKKIAPTAEDLALRPREGFVTSFYIPGVAQAVPVPVKEQLSKHIKQLLNSASWCVPDLLDEQELKEATLSPYPYLIAVSLW